MGAPSATRRTAVSVVAMAHRGAKRLNSYLVFAHLTEASSSSSILRVSWAGDRRASATPAAWQVRILTSLPSKTAHIVPFRHPALRFRGPVFRALSAALKGAQAACYHGGRRGTDVYIHSKKGVRSSPYPKVPRNDDGESGVVCMARAFRRALALFQVWPRSSTPAYAFLFSARPRRVHIPNSPPYSVPMPRL